MRIIGGVWRGRKLPFADAEGLRPTTDRIRETVFNWLAPEIAGARCLDLFAGSGALGLEALSRGADFSCFIDTSAVAIQQINTNLDRLDCDSAATYCITASQWLEQFDPAREKAFNVVFLDPPFGKNQLDSCLELIEQKHVLNNNGLAYLETPRDEALPAISSRWQLHREKTAGQVSYRLYRFGA